MVLVITIKFDSILLRFLLPRGSNKSMTPMNGGSIRRRSGRHHGCLEKDGWRNRGFHFHFLASEDSSKVLVKIKRYSNLQR